MNFLQLIHELFLDVVQKYSRNREIVSLQEFQKFLLEEQGDSMAKNSVLVANFIKEYIQDVQRDVAEPYLTVQEVNTCFSISCKKSYPVLLYFYLFYFTVHRLPFFQSKPIVE